MKIRYKCVKVEGLHLCLPNCMLQCVLETKSASSQGRKTMYQQKDFQIYQIFIMPVDTYISEYYY